MNNKNAILGGILLVSVALAWLYSNPFQDWRAERAKPDNIFSAVQVDKVSKIDLQGGGQDISFEKVGDRWLIADTKDFYLTDETAAAMTAGLRELGSSEVELVSENADKKQEFQTDSETGITITLYEGDQEVSALVLGKLTNDFSGTYISKPDDNATYISKTDLRSALAKQDWYDMRIFNNDTAAINNIRLQYSNREFTVEKAEDIWKGTKPYGFSVTNEKIETIANLMSKLTAAEIPAQTFDGTGLDKHEIIIQATGDGIDNTLMIGAARESEDKDGETLYYAKKGSSDNIYLITTNDKNELDKQIWQLR